MQIDYSIKIIQHNLGGDDEMDIAYKIRVLSPVLFNIGANLICK